MPTNSPNLDWINRWGRPESPDHGVTLGAGRWQGRLVGDELVDLRVDDRQVVRRVCVRVRDVDWNTVPGAPSPPQLSDAPAELTAAFSSLHVDADTGIDFEWSGQLSGRADDTLDWKMAGRARRTFEYNRIGICLLFNPDVVVGSRYRATRSDREVSGRIEELIAPQAVRDGSIVPMFDAFTELELELPDGGTMRCSFSGDSFEMEDQRNWSDGSLKVYSTPVGNPVPRRARAGEEIVQTVRIEFGRADVAVRRPAFTRRTPLGRPPVRLTLGEPGRGVVPPLGLTLDHDGHSPNPGELELLRQLAPAHLRVDISAGDPGSAVQTLDRASRVANELAAELEIAISISRTQEAPGSLVTALKNLAVPVARIVVLDGAAVTGAARAELVRGILPGVPIACGTDAYFAECNRDRPDLTGVDGFAYPLTPQVHDRDEQALVESLTAQAATVQTARTFAGTRPIHISPITLKPRWNPLGKRVAAAGTDGIDQLPAGADHRQRTTFAAAWTLGSIHRLTVAGAASLTFYELTGWRGLIGREPESLQREPQRPSDPYPLFWILAEAARLRGRDCLPAEAADPLGVEALAVRDAEGLVLLVANLLPAAVRLRVEPLDVDVVAAAPLTAPGWGEAEPREVRRGVCELDLEPWSATRVSAGPARGGSASSR